MRRAYPILRTLSRFKRTVSIQDDGVGFVVAEALEQALHGASAGLLGMQERTILLGGQFAIESTPGNGTTIRAHFPYRPAPAPE